jgi:hypothetical protein
LSLACPTEPGIAAPERIARCRNSSPFFGGVPVDIGDVGIPNNIYVVDIYVRVIAIPPAVKATSPPGMESFKWSQGHPANSAAPTNSDAEAPSSTPAEKTDQSGAPEVR